MRSIRRMRMVALGVGALALGAGNAEADPRSVGLEVAVGVGLMVPAGNLGGIADGPPTEHYGNTAEGDVFSDGLALTIDAGLRTRRFFLGPTLQYGILFGCGRLGGGSCQYTDLQVGGEARLYLLPEERWDPWLGAGVGYELGTAGVDYSGWTLDARIGLDVKIDATDAARIGPFLSVCFGEYTHESGDDTFQGALHEWFTLGLRVVWDPR